jgi:4-amino-4-deoxy-L-arabinose transferase-like glycosyltransferase
MTLSRTGVAIGRLPGIVFVVAVTVLLYAPYLGSAPVYLGQDEVFFGVTAHSIASTGNDINGRFLPLYFQWPGRTPAVWFQPVPVYVMAFFLKIVPLSEWSIRLPTLLFGIADIVLIYFVAARMFKSERSGLIAAALLVLTPAHMIHSRLAMDFLYPVAFVLSWLLCLLAFLERRQLSMLFAATTCLGLGFYSYIASIVLMPIYLLITCLTVWQTDRRPQRPLLVAIAGFCWPLTAAVAWLFSHSAAVVDTAQRYGLEGALPGQAHGATALSAAAALTERLSLYWRYFDPAYLFVAGGGYAVNTTHRVGVFLLPVAVYLVIGLSTLVNVRRTRVNVLLLLGLVTAPLAACLVAEAYAIQRELVILPFVVLIATCGFQSLWARPQTTARRLAWCLILLMVVQFSVFYADYFTRYQARSAFAFGGNIRGGLEEIVDRERPGDARPVYLSAEIPFVDLYWRFYLAKYGRDELLKQTVYFDPRGLDPHAIPDRSLVLGRHGASAIRAGAGSLRMIRPINSLDQTVCCELLENAAPAATP